MNPNIITIKQYLDRKGVEYVEKGDELIARCLISNCDENRTQKEWRLYFNRDTSQYHCKRCNEQGNIFTLAEALGDSKESLYINPPRRGRPKGVLKPTTDLVDQLHAALPANIRDYLHQRGLSDIIIDQHKIGWGNFYNQSWVVIPITNKEGRYTLLKLRKDPNGPVGQPKMLAYPRGAQHEIYGWELVNQKNVPLVICEGEFDRLVLLTNGIPAITGTGGCATFKDEWIQELKNNSALTVCFDTDAPGQAGAAKVISGLLKAGHESVGRIVLPEMGEGLKDVTDFFVARHGKTREFLALAQLVTAEQDEKRFVAISRPFTPTTLEQWREEVKSNFPELLFPAELGLSILTQVLIRDVNNPFALVLVGVPSGGKTITINFFDGIDELTYATDKFTSAAFISNASNVKPEKLAELDLLPRLRHKMFLIRDLATIFSKREEDLKETLGVLTRVLDGEGLATDTGVHGRRALNGSYLFMILAASTPISGRVWRMMGSLGSRLFFYSMRSKEKNTDELVNQLKDTSFKEKEARCRKATRNLLYTLWSTYPDGVEWGRKSDDDEILTIIVRSAKLLARLRGVAGGWKERKGRDGEVEYDSDQPIIENPDRINILFYNLARGHALVAGRHKIERSDLAYVLRLAIDSAPPSRTILFLEIIKNNGTLTTQQAAQALQSSQNTALVEMKILVVLGVCSLSNTKSQGAGRPTQEISLKEEYLWFCSEEYRDIIDTVEIN